MIKEQRILISIVIATFILLASCGTWFSASPPSGMDGDYCEKENCGHLKSDPHHSTGCGYLRNTPPSNTPPKKDYCTCSGCGYEKNDGHECPCDVRGPLDASVGKVINLDIPRDISGTPIPISPTATTKKERLFDSSCVQVGMFCSYNLGGSDIDTRNTGLLDALLDSLRDSTHWKIEIFGHSDSIGTPDRIVNVANARANKMRDYLINKQIGADRIVITSGQYGERYPLINNKKEVANRRTEITIIKCKICLGLSGTGVRHNRVYPVLYPQIKAQYNNLIRYGG